MALDLKLTDEDMRALGNRIRKRDGIELGQYVDIEFSEVADAATAKAAWGIVEWLFSDETEEEKEKWFAYGGPGSCEYGCVNIIEILKARLEAAGIQKSEAKTI